MPVPTDITALSTTASSNYPAGTENLNTADDYLRQQFAFIAQLRDRAISVKDYGATGDGITDDTTAIQSAIDACNAAGGGTVYFPVGAYLCNVTLKAGVFLVGHTGGFGYLAGGTPVAQTKLVAAATGYLIDTPATASNCGVVGLNLQGLGAATACKGIRFQDVDYGVIKSVHLNNFSDEGILISAGLACVIEDVLAINCVLDTTQVDVIGAIDIAGTDHFICRVEATVSGSAVSDANLYCCAFVDRSTNSFIDSLVGEISDIGIYVSGSQNRYSNCRADLNWGHGWYITGGGNQFSNCLGLNNSQGTTNTYDNWQATSASANNVFSNCLAANALTAKARYDFNDAASTATNKNKYVNCYGDGNTATAQYNVASSAGSGMVFAPGGQRTLTANSTTPSVVGFERFITANTVGTTVTDFAAGTQGQLLVILCNDSNTTIQHNGATIVTFNGGNLKLVSGQMYQFVKMGALWRQVYANETQVSADNGDAAKTIQARIDAPTQQWASALSVGRAVTLSTTGAYSGAKFRIVRTAASTGASTLDVGTGPLKALAAGQWCDVEYNGSAWMLTAFGSL